MADYYSSTVVQPALPIADISPLERLLLANFFESEVSEHDVYFFSSEN